MDLIFVLKLALIGVVFGFCYVFRHENKKG